MIAVTPCERRALKKFRYYVKKYADPKACTNPAVRLKCCSKSRQTTLCEEVAIPDSDVHHLMDAPLIQAITRTIEDIAEEEGQGELIAAFQVFTQFAPHKKRYCELAQKLGTVRVWGAGEVPSCRKIDFINAGHPKIARYWMVLFDSPHCRAILLCKQLNKTDNLSEKKFVGFYSFNPYLVQSIRWRFNLLSCGLVKVVDLWEKSFPLPDVRMRDVNAYFKRASAGMNSAL